MIRYKSTRGAAETKTSAAAIIKGIAEDKGLFVPERIPKLPFSIEELCTGRPGDVTDKCYQDIAKMVIGAFFEDFSSKELEECIEGAYDKKFEKKKIVPITKAGGAYFLELYHGKTAAFKDMALSLLPYLLTTSMKKEREDKKICILTATSGDTGKAALEGFADVPGTEIIVFYPDRGVSQVQERQMLTQTGENTHVFAVKGNFDDAQTGVKKIFGDDGFAGELEASGVRLSSANSINIGRLVPQVAYYVYGYIKLVKEGVIKPGEKINITVPTGNFGNILSAYYAGEMGIPVNRLICASNKNRILMDFINTGVYDLHREFYLTNSPSMDIIISSNLERLLWHLCENGEEIKILMEKMEKENRYEVSAQIRQGMERFYGGYTDIDATLRVMGDMYRQNGYLIDTHTAVAYDVYEQYKNDTGDQTPTLIAATASAYKFADSAAEAIGIGKGNDGFDSIKKLAAETGVPVPKALKDLDKKEIRHEGVIDISAMKDSVREALG